MSEPNIMPSILKQLRSLHKLLGVLLRFVDRDYIDLTIGEKIKYSRTWTAVKNRLKYFRKYEVYDLYVGNKRK